MSLFIVVVSVIFAAKWSFICWQTFNKWKHFLHLLGSCFFSVSIYLAYFCCLIMLLNCNLCLFLWKCYPGKRRPSSDQCKSFTYATVLHIHNWWLQIYYISQTFHSSVNKTRQYLSFYTDIHFSIISHFQTHILDFSKMSP